MSLLIARRFKELRSAPEPSTDADAVAILANQHYVGVDAEDIPPDRTTPPLLQVRHRSLQPRGSRPLTRHSYILCVQLLTCRSFGL